MQLLKIHGKKSSVAERTISQPITAFAWGNLHSLKCWLIKTVATMECGDAPGQDGCFNKIY
jgi:hypothetical protein